MKILKTTKEKRHIVYRGVLIKMIADLFSIRNYRLEGSKTIFKAVK